MNANLFPRPLVEVLLGVDVAERHAEVRVRVPGAALPTRRLLLQPEHLLRELEAEIAELLQRQRRDGRVHAPPDESD